MSVKDLLGVLSHLNEENISKLYEVAMSMLSSEVDDEPSPTPTLDPSPTNQKKNLFDEMPEKDQFRDPEDKKLYSLPPTPRRPDVQLLQLKCRSCGAENSVPPPLVPVEVDRYLCNKCAKSGG